MRAQSLRKAEKKDTLHYNKDTISVQGGMRSDKDDFYRLHRYIHSAYVPVRVVHVPCRQQKSSLSDSATPTVANSPAVQTDD